MHEIIGQLSAYLRAMWRHRWYALAVAWLVSLAGWAVVISMPSRYEASARIYVDTTSILGPLMQGLAIKPNLDQQVGMIARTLITRPNLEKVLRNSDLDLRAKNNTERETLVDLLQSRIQLIGTGKDNLFSLTYWDSHPDQAKKVVQSLVNIFVESSLGDKRKDSESARRFLDEQIKSYEQKLVVAENALKEFKQKHMGLMPDEKQNYYGRLSEASARLNQAQLELKEAENARDSIKSQIAGEDPVLLPEETPAEVAEAERNKGSARRNPELDERIQSLEKNLDAYRLKYTEQHPDIIATKRILAQLQEQKEKENQEAKVSEEIEQAKRAEEAKVLAGKGGPGYGASRQNLNPVFQQLKVALGEAEATVASIRARVNEFQNRLTDLKSQANMVPQVEAELSQLNRDYEVNKANYEKLLARRESATMSNEMDAGTGGLDFRVIDPPRVPPIPSSPNRPLLYTLVLLAGLLLGLALAFAMSQIRPMFSDREALREFTGLPLLGSVSMIWTPDQKRKSRQGTVVYTMTCLGLLCVYGAVMTANLLREEGIISKVRTLTNL
jgi:polysaccharide chain length determinant protein (PEP-CTERM system associated)